MVQKRYIIIILMVIIVLAQILASVYVYKYLCDKELDSTNEFLNRKSVVIFGYLTRLELFISHTLNVVASGCGLLGKFIEPNNFAKLVSFNTLSVAASIRYQRWYPYITNEERPQYELFGNQYIRPNFTIIDFISIFPTINFQPAGIRDYYYPLSASVPDLPPSVPKGGDLISSPLSSASIEALSRLRLTATSRVRLLDLSIINYATALFIPSFNTNGTLLGYVNSIIVLNNIMSEIIKTEKLNREDIDIIIIDKSNDINDTDRLIYREDKSIYALLDSYNEESFNDIVDEYGGIVTNIKFIDRSYTFVLIFSKEFRSQQENYFPESILIMMVLISVFVDVIILSSIVISLKSIDINRQNVYLKMLTAVNHHMRNPLNGIMGYIEIIIYDLLEYIGIKIDDVDILLLKGFTTNRSIEFTSHKMSETINMLTDVYSLCKYLKYIVNDANFITGLIKNNVYPIQKTKISAKKMFDKTNFITNSIREEFNNISYEFNNNLTEDVVFLSDEKIILQVLIVLINTGFACTKTKMSFMLDKIHTTLRFTIRNDGNVNDIENILNTATNENLIGLNLEYTSKLADMIGGVIEFDNTLANENRVTFTIPINDVLPIQIHIPTETTQV